MSMTADLIIRNATLVDAGGLVADSWVAVDSGLVVATGTGAPGFRATETFDAGGAMLFPGLIDSHVHFREPGLEQKATIASESRAALAGGITSYLEMPNTKPPTLTADALADKYLRAAARSAANYGFFLGATATTASELRLVPRHRLPALKLFMGATTGAVSTPPPAALEEIFRICSAEDIVVMVHAEDDAIIAAEAAKAISRFGSRENVPVGMHRTIRSREACVTASSRAVELATRHNTRLHIAHVSTVEEVERFLRAGSPEAKRITAETTPLYLDPQFDEAALSTGRLKVNPAIKGSDDAEALRHAVDAGLIDTIATDHAPHLPADKEGGALTAASGAPSVQFALPVMLGYLSPQTICRAMACNPAGIFGIRRRGRIAPGYVADFTLVETAEPYTITDSHVVSPCGWTPFAGRTVSHKVASVWLAGRMAYDRGTFTGAAPRELEFGKPWPDVV